MKKSIILTLLISFAGLQLSNACTNFLITKGASIDGTNMITYAADSHTLYGELYFWPAADYADGTKLKVYEWDTGKYLGEIDQVSHTHQVTGNINEFGLSIGETTYGGRSELVDSMGIMDYGSLIYIALQRAKTAREAIQVIGDLVAEYGYYSSGESFSIADPEEVWILEMIGKGPGKKGAVWVAQRIPDGAVSAHANQARITTIDFKDNANYIYSKDVYSFAKKMNYFEGKKEDFSFSDVYAPLDYGAIRFCEARVWSFFNMVNPELAQQYIPYIEGSSHQRMPLYIKPAKKLSYRDVQHMMRDHFEGTPFDMTQDVGAGAFSCPYRWRPLTWSVEGDTLRSYFNERAIATQQTGFSFIAQLRSDVPAPMKGVLWFGVDDASSTVYVPIYGGIKEVPPCFKVGNGNMLEFSWTSAFWIFNWVTNMSYSRYSYIHEDVVKIQKELEDGFEKSLPLADKKAIALYATDRTAFYKYISEYSQAASATTFNKWKSLGEFLMVKYIDGNIKKETNGVFHKNAYGLPASPDQPGYSKAFYKQVVKQTGEKLLMKGAVSH